MLRRILLGAATALTLVTAACGDSDGPTEIVYSNPATAKYDPALGIDINAMRLQNGVYVQDVVVGTGATAAVTSTVTMNYSGYMPSGRRFDSGTLRNQPLGGLVEGFGAGVAGMRLGGRRKLVIPPSLGYPAGNPQANIPANSVIVFDVQLVSIP